MHHLQQLQWHHWTGPPLFKSSLQSGPWWTRDYLHSWRNGHLDQTSPQIGPCLSGSCQTVGQQRPCYQSVYWHIIRQCCLLWELCLHQGYAEAFGKGAWGGVSYWAWRWGPYWLMGPALVATNKGCRYYVSFTDDKTQLTHLYLLKYKSDTLHTYKEYKASIKTQHNANICTLHSDCGSKYTGKNFIIHLNEKVLSKAYHSWHPTTQWSFRVTESHDSWEGVHDATCKQSAAHAMGWSHTPCRFGSRIAPLWEHLTGTWPLTKLHMGRNLTFVESTNGVATAGCRTNWQSS